MKIDCFVSAYEVVPANLHRSVINSFIFLKPTIRFGNNVEDKMRWRGFQLESRDCGGAGLSVSDGRVSKFTERLFRIDNITDSMGLRFESKLSGGRYLGAVRL